MESKVLARAKSHMKSKLKTTILSQCSHHLIPGHNKNQCITNINEEFNAQKYLSEMFQEFPYNSDFPKPLLPPSKMQRDCSAREDSSTQAVHIKVKIQDDIKRYLDLYKKHSNNFSKYLKKDIEWKKEPGIIHTMLSRYLAATAEILDCDPDPNFYGSYNWYYSGGTLNNILYDTRNILIFPYAGELIAIPLRFKEDSLIMPDYKDAAKITINNDLYQVVTSVSNNDGRILSRHKNDCIMYSLFNMDKKKLRLLEINKKQSNIPYISVDLDPLSVNRYCTTDVERNIYVWDVTKSKYIWNGRVPVTRFFNDNWAFIKYNQSDNNILKFIDRHCVHYYDIRMPMERSVITMCPKNNLEDCEYLSSYAASLQSEYFSYIGSYHSLCLLDSRFPNNAVVKKWSHLFKSPPIFTDVCVRENKEFITIASQMAEEKTIIVNNWNSIEEPPETYSTPFTPPSSIETLIALQKQGKCLNPHMRNRLLLCNTGCKALIDKQNGDVFLAIQNSINDIFYQGISHEESLNLYSLKNCKSLYKMKIWEREISKNSHHDIISPLVVTKRTSARNIFTCFTNQKFDFAYNAIKEQKEIDYVPLWKRSISELNSYIDLFAPELLSQWQISEEAPLVPITAEPYDKVMSWLENAQEETAQNDSESIQMFLPKVKSFTRPKNKKNTKQPKYIPGF